MDRHTDTTAEAQGEGWAYIPGMHCPRCGREAMRLPVAVNSLSRMGRGIYICTQCGIDEAMLDWQGINPWPGFPEVMAR